MNAINNILSNTIKMAEETAVKTDEFLNEDNLIYCRKCLTPRQVVIEVLDRTRIVRCICKCQKEQLDLEEKLKKENEKRMKILKLQETSLLGERYKNIRFENTNCEHSEDFKKIFIRCQKYCEASEEVIENGFGIYLYGGSGTGKTHLTSCMANRLMEQHKQVLFTNFFEISKVIRDTFNGKGSESQQIKRFADIDFLFIDDLGTERVKNNGEDTWLQEKIFEVINKRYNNKKPTIFTSNYSIQELINDRGIMQKTVDRIVEMSNLIYKLDGQSYRLSHRKRDIPY